MYFNEFYNYVFFLDPKKILATRQIQNDDRKNSVFDVNPYNSAPHFCIFLKVWNNELA
jgi:hypothetical protein